MIYYGYKVFLSPIEIEDCMWVQRIRNNRDYNKFFRQVGLINVQQQQIWFAKMCSDPTQKLYSIKENREGETIGIGGLTGIDYFSRKAELSCYTINWVHEIDAIKTIVAHGFNDLNLHRIWAETFDTHEQHLKILGDIGFEAEGILKDSYWKDGKYISSFIHAIVKD
jgi:RimJ/RimL family protein N-acetyltransferase